MVLTVEHKIQGEEFPPYIYLNLPISAPWFLTPPLIPNQTPNPTHLNP